MFPARTPALPILALLALLGALLGALVPGARADVPGARAEPFLAGAASGGQVRLYAGEWPEGAAAPVFDRVVVRSGEGSWSAPRTLTPPRSGLPLMLRDTTWFLDGRRDVQGVWHHVLLPDTGERHSSGFRIEHVQGRTGSAAASLDPWTFLVAEAAGAHLFVRAFTTHGSTMETELVREAAWTSSWPEGTRLLAAGEAGPFAVLVGIGPEGFVASGHDGATATEFPPLPAADGPVAACVLADGPMVAAAQGSRISTWRWESTRWGGEIVTEMPDGATVRALALTALGTDRGAALLSALAGDAPGTIVSRRIGEEPGELERTPLQSPPASVGAPRDPRGAVADAEGRISRLRILRWSLLVVAVPILALVLRRLGRRR